MAAGKYCRIKFSGVADMDLRSLLISQLINDRNADVAEGDGHLLCQLQSTGINFLPWDLFAKEFTVFNPVGNFQKTPFDLSNPFNIGMLFKHQS